jgi:hypothetical protein
MLQENNFERKHILSDNRTNAQIRMEDKRALNKREFHKSKNGP